MLEEFYDTTARNSMFTQAMFNQVRGKLKVKSAALTLTLINKMNIPGSIEPARIVVMVNFFLAWVLNGSHSLESLKSHQPNDKQNWFFTIVANLTIATEIEFS